MIQVEEQEAPRQTQQVFLMSKDQIDHYWPHIVRILGEIPGYYDFFTPEWTYSRAAGGHLQVWGFSDGEIKGLAVTQVLVFPATKAFEILGAGGIGMVDFFDPMEDVFEKIAADAECNMIIARARPGLARLLARKKGVIQGAVWIYRPVGKKQEH